MVEEMKAEVKVQEYLTSLMNTMVSVITTPVDFYRSMPKVGGLSEPLIFMVAMGVAAGLIRTLLGVFGLGSAGASFMMAIAAVVVTPIFVVIFGFVGAAILFAIWKILGSQESFEVAFRCGAYAMAISPVTSLLQAVPYVGNVAAIAWMTYLLVIACMEVHRIEEKKAWIVFGILGGLLALSSISSEFTARKIAGHLETLQKNMGKMEDMSPEEAGKKVGEFMKGMQEGAGKSK